MNSTARLLSAFLCALCALCVLFSSGCAAPQPARLSRAVGDPYIGEWRSDGGVTVRIFADAQHDHYHVTSNRSGHERSTEGQVIDIDGTAVAMNKVYEPTDAERARGAVPLYLFGILNLRDGELKHTPIRAEWLQQAITAEHDRDARYIDSSSVSKGTGVGIVEDWDDMEEILRRAISSAEATGPTEVFHRVK
ncbi:MAG: hypothetical protein IT436_11910 [Phycisphaerales bacterium]|nr:hypothetical protein [Phycisphaerales bacterium]